MLHNKHTRVVLTQFKEVQLQLVTAAACPVHQAHTFSRPSTIRMDAEVMFKIFQGTVAFQSKLKKCNYNHPAIQLKSMDLRNPWLKFKNASKRQIRNTSVTSDFVNSARCVPDTQKSLKTQIKIDRFEDFLVEYPVRVISVVVV